MGQVHRDDLGPGPGRFRVANAGVYGYSSFQGLRRFHELLRYHPDVVTWSFGANDAQTLRAFTEAEAYPGPALLIAYSHCISHGYDLRLGLDQQKKAVASGYWPLFRYNPLLAQEGKNPFVLDSKAPSISVDKYMYAETRFRVLTQSDPARAEELLKLAQSDVDERWKHYASLAAQPA